MIKNTALFFGSLLFLHTANAAIITNQINGIGSKEHMIYPVYCLKDGRKIEHNASSTNITGYVGGDLRFGGCSTDDTYLGYLGLSIGDSNTIAGYSAPQGIHIAYTDAAIDNKGNLTGAINYTAIKSNFTLPAARANNHIPFVGANLSGLEFSKTIDPFTVPNLSQEDANSTLSDLKDTTWFINAGMNTFRLPLHWGFLQLGGAGKGEINKAYYDSFVKPMLESLTSSKVNVIVDLHAYMRYSKFGEEYAGCGEDGNCPDGTLISDATPYVDVWSKLYDVMRQDPKINMDYILLDLVNEPVDAPNDSVFTTQAAVIKKLRSDGFNGYILVEGNAWSGLHSWTTSSWQSTDGKTTYTNASLFSRENFAKAGITDLNKIVINAHQYLDANYSGTGATCLTDLTTRGDNGFNLDTFADYLKQNHLKAMVTEFGGGKDSTSCANAMTSFLDYMQSNAAGDKDYGFIGWTIWSTGHGWGNYNLRVTPTSYHMGVLKYYLN